MTRAISPLSYCQAAVKVIILHFRPNMNGFWKFSSRFFPSVRPRSSNGAARCFYPRFSTKRTEDTSSSATCQKPWEVLEGPQPLQLYSYPAALPTGRGFLASGEKFPYKSAVREQSDQADLRRPQTTCLLLKKVAAATFLTSCGGYQFLRPRSQKFPPFQPQVPISW